VAKGRRFANALAAVPRALSLSLIICQWLSDICLPATPCEKLQFSNHGLPGKLGKRYSFKDGLCATACALP
jgi:hypothetical protein